MGTDINLWAEYKDKNGQWVEDSLTYDSCRYYPIYAVLAPSSRYPNIKPISENRYLPEDYKTGESYKEYLKWREDPKTAYYYDSYPWDKRFNVTSYHILSQLKQYNWDEVIKEIDWIKEEEFYSSFLPALQRLADKHGGDDNVRIVFYFDS